MNGFGRLIITLDKPVKAVARSSNGILVIEFEEAVRIDHTKLPIEARNTLPFRGTIPIAGPCASP